MAFSTMDIMKGDVNPSGHLPLTFPKIENQEGMTEEQYPGLDGGMNISYSETFGFGYRWYHLNKQDPAFWFGYGMSYTSFEMNGAEWSSDNSKVSAKFRNSGDIAGNMVPQLYIQMSETCNTAIWKLNGFEKVFLQPGETITVDFPITERDQSVWDVETHSWRKCLGSASARISWSANFGDGEFIEAKTEFKY